MEKIRIDALITERGLADSRSRAQAMIMSGNVLVNEKRVDKPSERYPMDASIRLKNGSGQLQYVSRGGLKLEAAITAFAIDAAGLVCIDVGSSTGGFTDCLLQNGARLVTCVDSGTNQLDWRLRSDQRVDVRENVNARNLLAADFEVRFDLAVMDVSFISVTKIVPAILALLKPEGKLIVLIKPQFEVGRGEVGKGGIVRESEKHDRVVAEIDSFMTRMDLDLIGRIDSPILGAKGNKEFLACYAKR